jgi:hypothetical protein
MCDSLLGDGMVTLSKGGQAMLLHCNSRYKVLAAILGDHCTGTISVVVN